MTYWRGCSAGSASGSERAGDDVDARIATWIDEMRRFNPRAHLVGPGLLGRLEEDAGLMEEILDPVRERELADIGSGGGLAAAVAKVLHPDMRVICVDRSERKCIFLRHAALKAGIRDLEILRADLLGPEALRFGAAMARAFSPLSTLETVCQRVLPDGGRLYYIFTRDAPVLGERFLLEDVSSAGGPGHTLSLATFRHILP